MAPSSPSSSPAERSTVTETISDRPNRSNANIVAGFESVQALLREVVLALDRLAAIATSEPTSAASDPVSDRPTLAPTRVMAGPPTQAPTTADEANDRTTAQTMAALCLQPFQLYVNDAPVNSWPGPRSIQTMLLLLCHHPRPVSRDVLIEALWPDIEPVTGRHRLHQQVHRLRQALKDSSTGEPLLSYSHGAYGIESNVEVWTDVNEFEQLIAAGDRAAVLGDVEMAIRSYRGAETLYADDYLADHPFDDWIGPRRQLLRQQYLLTVGRLIDLYRARHDHPSAIAAAQRLLRCDPTNESVSRRLMQSHVAQGQRHLAAAEFYRCRAALRHEFELDPSTETLELFSRIRAS